MWALRAAGAFCVALAAAASPSPAMAHLVGVEFGDFYAGALHVFTAVEHLTGLAALALLATIQPRLSGRWVLVAGPLGLLVGALAATLSVTDRTADAAVIGSFALIGALAAWGARLRPEVVAGLAAALGVAHGWANGLAAAEARLDPWLYSAGVASAGCVAVTLAASLAASVSDRLPNLAVIWRVMGSWIAAAGLAALGLSAARAATGL